MNITQSPPSADLVQQSDRLDGYLQHDPSNEQLLADAFDAAMAAGRMDRAEAYAVAALAITAQAAFWKFRQASCAIARKDLAAALALLSGLQSMSPVEPAVLFNLGFVHYGLKQYQACAEALEPLVAGCENDPQWISRAQALWLRALHRLGELKRAWAWVIEAQQAERSLDAEVCGVASLLALDVNQLDDAQRLAQRALQRLPSQPEALVVRGSIALGHGNAAVAAVAAQTVLHDHGDDGRTRSLLGFALLLAQDLPGAIENFQRAVALMPEHIGTWHGLGWTQLLLGNLEAAVQAFTAALEIDRNFAENHGALAVALAKQGRAQEAGLLVERALRLDPAAASAQYAKLLLNGHAGDPAAIQRLAQRLLKRLAPAGLPSWPAG